MMMLNVHNGDYAADDANNNNKDASQDDGDDYVKGVGLTQRSQMTLMMMYNS